MYEKIYDNGCLVGVLGSTSGFNALGGGDVSHPTLREGSPYLMNQFYGSQPRRCGRTWSDIGRIIKVDNFLKILEIGYVINLNTPALRIHEIIKEVIVRPYIRHITDYAFYGVFSTYTNIISRQQKKELIDTKGAVDACVSLKRVKDHGDTAIIERRVHTC